MTKTSVLAHAKSRDWPERLPCTVARAHAADHREREGRWSSGCVPARPRPPTGITGFGREYAVRLLPPGL